MRCGRWLGLAIFLGGAALLPAGAAPVGREGPGGREAPPPPGRGADHPGRHPRGGNPAAGMMRKLDTDRDGAITFEEFAASERLSGIADEGRRRIFDRLDKNRDGVIRREELPGRGPRHRPWDPNRDGRVSLEEFLADPRLGQMPVERRKAMFERLDRDGNGFLTRGDWPRRGQRGGAPGGGPGHAGRSFPDPEEMARLDGDGDGALSFDEWRRRSGLGKLDDERLRQMFRRLDRNDDDRLDRRDRPKRARHPGPPPPGAPDP